MFFQGELFTFSELLFSYFAECDIAYEEGKSILVYPRACIIFHIRSILPVNEMLLILQSFDLVLYDQMFDCTLQSIR